MVVCLVGFAVHFQCALTSYGQQSATFIVLFPSGLQGYVYNLYKLIQYSKYLRILTAHQSFYHWVL